jgi:acetyltransferase-like isoleucine patch superfamily enzyme
MSLIKSSLRQLVSIIRYPKLFLFSKRMGKNNRFGPDGRFLHPKEIYLGDNIYIAPNFHISARNLRIGNNVLIGPNLLLECDDHTFRNVGKTIWATYKKERILGSVTIEDDVWLGGNVTILKNVLIGEGCIIGAASVVTKSLPPYSICIGSPCRPIKSRFSSEELNTHLSLVKSAYKFTTIIDQWKKIALV